MTPRTPLHIVTPDEPAPAKAASFASQVKTLQEQIAALSGAQLDQLLALVGQVCELAAEVGANPAQPPGIRDLARRLGEDTEVRAVTMRAVAARTS